MSSCGLTRCLTAGFSLCSLFPVCFHRCQWRRLMPFGGLTGSMGAELWVFHRKTAVREITRGWKNVHTNPPVAAAGLGSRSKCGPQTRSTGMARTCWKCRIPGSTPDSLGQNLHINKAQDSYAHYCWRGPDAELLNFSLLIDGRVYFLTLISCIRYLHTRGYYTAI